MGGGEGGHPTDGSPSGEEGGGGTGAPKLPPFSGAAGSARRRGPSEAPGPVGACTWAAAGAVTCAAACIAACATVRGAAAAAASSPGQGELGAPSGVYGLSEVCGLGAPSGVSTLHGGGAVRNWWLPRHAALAFGTAAAPPAALHPPVVLARARQPTLGGTGDKEPMLSRGLGRFGGEQAPAVASLAGDGKDDEGGDAITGCWPSAAGCAWLLAGDEARLIRWLFKPPLATVLDTGGGGEPESGRAGEPPKPPPHTFPAAALVLQLRFLESVRRQDVGARPSRSRP